MADLVDPGSHAPIVSAWDQPLAVPNLEDARIAHRFAPLAGMPVLGRVESAVRQRFRLKSWQYMTVACDELFMAFVVGTAGFASNGFVYAAELPSGRVHERFAITPLRVGTQLAPSSAAGTHRFATRHLTISVDNHGRSFDASIRAHTVAGEPLAAELHYTSAPGDEHLAICVPLPNGRWSYTHKLACFAVTGHVELGGRRIALANGYGSVDFTKQFAQRHSVWRWISVCGKSKRGAVIGLNLVDPTPPAPVSENAAWIDGKREPLSEVRLDPAGAGWKIGADSIDLEMSPVAEVTQKLDVPLVRHRLRHIVGAFSGRVRTRGGQVHELDRVVGIAEDYDTWW
jgi:hypothetical protein